MPKETTDALRNALPLKFDSMRQIILDTETTGLEVKNGHRIIEVAAVEMINRKLTGQYYHQYICPRREIDQGAFQVHGISQEFLADKPEFHQISAALLDFISGAELIIHNASFDIGFLNSEFQRSNPDFDLKQHCGVLDTLLFARKKHPGVPNNLDALCRRYEIDNSNRQLHGALLDCHLLAAVYLAMTGGQTTLFAETYTVQQRPELTPLEKIAAINLNQLAIIKASEREVQQHLALLQRMTAENGGLCVWDIDEQLYQ